MAFPFAQISAGAKGNLGIILNNTFHLCKLKPRALATLKILSILTCFSRPRDQEQLCCPVQALGRQICITEYLRPPVQVLRRQSSAHTRYPRPPRQPGQCLACSRAPGAHGPEGPCQHSHCLKHHSPPCTQKSQLYLSRVSSVVT